MTVSQVDLVFQVIVFLFAISVHESAHAWSALRLGDPTAYMLGRVTLNPVKHIDPIGTILMPVLAMLTHLPLIGWAKPTPVNTRNLKRFVRDDVIVSLAGIAANLVFAGLAVVALIVVMVAVPGGKGAVDQAITLHWGGEVEQMSQSIVLPLSLLLYDLMMINILLACFNIIPVPPLDGSHVLRHMLPDSVRGIYDNVGRFGLLILMFFGGRILLPLMRPVLQFFHFFLNLFLS
jgi:Zn-dependent protease